MPPVKSKAVAEGKAPAKVEPRRGPTTPRPMAGYHRHVRRFPLVPIRDEAHLAAAHEILASFGGREYDDDEALYVAALIELVGVYEDRHWPAERLPAAEMLRAFMEEEDLSQSQLARETGIGQSTIAHILGGKRKMTVGHIEKFAARFRVSPGSFLPGK